MSRPSLVNLSIFQAFGLVITAIGGSGVWFVAAAISHPEDLGVLGRAISTSTLIAGLVTAGLGQFLLTIVNSSTSTQIRRYFLSGIVIGGLLSTFVAIAIGAFQNGSINQTTIAMGLFGAGIVVTNLQDAIYLGTGRAPDVPSKGSSILIVRLMLLLGCSIFSTTLSSLLTIFVVSQLAVGVIWAVIRIPKALKGHIPRSSGSIHTTTVHFTLVLSYLYSTAVACIVNGIPAIVTSIETPEKAGKFYIAWTIAGLLAGVSVAVANSVISISLGSRNKSWLLAQVLGGLLAALCIGGVLILFVLPRILIFVNSQYLDISHLLTMLIAGQVFFGVAIVALATYRVLTLSHHLIPILIAWPMIVVGSVIIGVANSGILGASIGFMIGNFLTTIPMCILAFRATFACERFIIGQTSENIA